MHKSTKNPYLGHLGGPYADSDYSYSSLNNRLPAQKNPIWYLGQKEEIGFPLINLRAQI